MATSFKYNGVTVPLPEGHRFVEEEKFDGSVVYTGSPGTPVTEDQSILVGVGDVIAGNKFKDADGTDLFAEGARARTQDWPGDLLHIAASTAGNVGFYEILYFETTDSPNDTVVVDLGGLNLEVGASYVFYGRE